MQPFTTGFRSSARGTLAITFTVIAFLVQLPPPQIQGPGRRGGGGGDDDARGPDGACGRPTPFVWAKPQPWYMRSPDVAGQAGTASMGSMIKEAGRQKGKKHSQHLRSATTIGGDDRRTAATVRDAAPPDEKKPRAHEDLHAIRREQRE